MEPFFIAIQIPSPAQRIHYPQKMMLSGSCFTEHIGNHLSGMKFDILQNPNGILFDPLSVAKSLISYIEPAIYRKEDLFFYNELWQSWNHHSVFSSTSQENALHNINLSQQRANRFLSEADWLIITLGSSFSYFLAEGGKAVANCHRAPAGWFKKKLVPIEQMLAVMDEAMHRLIDFNPRLKIIYTVSPVRHIRDGVIENNRSKARLIEVVHQLVDKFENSCYFPAYELVIDVLRDYRFFDKDLVHPNYAATHFVLEQFMENFMEADSRLLAEEIRKLQISRNHRPLHPDTEAHRRFLKEQLEKTQAMQTKYPMISFQEELDHFSEYHN